MPVLDDYVAACLPVPRTIAGVRVRPHSIGAALLLHRCGSPFVDLEHKNPGVGDCLLALFILSRSFADAAAGVNTRLVKDWMAVHEKRLRKLDEPNLDLQIVAHLAEGNSEPRHWPGKGRMPGAPFLQLLKLTLMAKLGFTEAEALNLPLAQAKWDYCAHWEAEGSLKLYNEADYALIEAHAQLQKEFTQRGNMTPAEFLRGGPHAPPRVPVGATPNDPDGGEFSARARKTTREARVLPKGGE